MKRFQLTDAQAEAILETKLRHLAQARGDEDPRRAEGARRRSATSSRRSSASKAKLKKLIRDEIIADAEKYGDDRRSKLVERAAAQAIAETELVASEPVTVVLSSSGWVRAAKGHEIDPRTLSLQDRRRVPRRGARPQHPAGRVPRHHRPHLQPAGAHAAVGARPGRAAVRPPQSAGWRELPRRADRRARRALAAGERRRLRLRRAARRPAHPQPGRQGGAERAGRLGGAGAGAGAGGRRGAAGRA